MRVKRIVLSVLIIFFIVTVVLHNKGKIDDFFIVKSLHEKGFKIPYTVKRIVKKDEYDNFHGDGKTTIVYKLPSSFSSSFQCNNNNMKKEVLGSKSLFSVIYFEEVSSRYFEKNKPYCVLIRREEYQLSYIAVIQNNFLFVNWLSW